jgi:hypothetical protein
MQGYRYDRYSLDGAGQVCKYCLPLNDRQIHLVTRFYTNPKNKNVVELEGLCDNSCRPQIELPDWVKEELAKGATRTADKFVPPLDEKL